jgi:hypothetical protein
VRIEPEIHAPEADGAADELDGAEREHDRQRDLAAHQRKPRPGAFGPAALDGAFAQRLEWRAA